ncbi:hypothetical protein JHK84_043030 [Glycine max]|nr:hypothetical protein JHK84_043030 [Glycine max]
MAVEMGTGVPWVMCKEDDAPDQVSPRDQNIETKTASSIQHQVWWSAVKREDFERRRGKTKMRERRGTVSGNLLDAPIPNSLVHCLKLDILSRNYLSGEIPMQLASLLFLSYLNLSFNHLV